MGLKEYKKKRDFSRTPEPAGSVRQAYSERLYVIQKHAASRLHYDLRLEMGGVLKSWAVPKGPSLDPGEKRLAVHVEDHPVEYGSFEGVIPEGEYGGGTVMLWDRGSWVPEGDPERGYRKGHLSFRLEGKKLGGSWTLARMGGRAGEGRNWLLIKRRDEEARPLSSGDLLEGQSLSVTTGRAMEEIASSRDRVWSGESGEARGVPDPSGLPGARRSSMPSSPRPQLAKLEKSPPPGDHWLHEIKYDGYRILCLKQGEKVRLLSRNGKDWTARFREVAEAAASMPADKVVLDGEMVVLHPDGRTDFQALQNAMEGLPSGRIGYYVFDILHAGGFDLARTPLAERKGYLKRLFESSRAPPFLLYGDHIRGKGEVIYEHACRLGMEGIVSKRADSRYEPRRSGSWVKVKCTKRQEFVLGGYTEPSGSRSGFGALLVGAYNGAGELVFCGRVGTGFDERSLFRTLEALKPLETQETPFANPPRGREARGVHWVSPGLVAEVEFTERTGEGVLRHPSFKGLREDKDPKEVRLEEPEGQPPSGRQTRRPRTSGMTTSQDQEAGRKRSHEGQAVAGILITNPDRILYPEQGITKAELARYYEKVAPRILPHLRGRPLALVRCPQGRQKKCFYQKHLTEQKPGSLKEIPVPEKEETRMYVSVEDLEGLVSLVQLGVLEFHPWGSRGDRLEKPDRLTFDLDPGEGITPARLVEATELLRSLLEEMGIRTFLKATGGKGFHVVAPFSRGIGWGELKEFAGQVALEAVRLRPNLLVSTMRKSSREGRVFVDYLRNGRGSTAVAPFSTRARPGAPVAATLSWEELTPSLTPDRYSVENVGERLARPDPWAGFSSTRQTLRRGIRKLMGV